MSRSRAPSAIYNPPVRAPRSVERLDLEGLAPGRVHHLKLALGEDGTGGPIRVPVIVAAGENPGPVVGLTAALHGNELNGVRVIHRLLATIEPEALSGTLVAAPLLNIPGYLANQRGYRDGADLNRLFPGKPSGTSSEQYAHNIVERLLRPLDVLFDLHTASFGRINSFYALADMSRPEVAELARLVAPQIIVHSKGPEGSMRRAASALGVKVVTIELGDPQIVQRDIVGPSRMGIRDALERLGMLAPDQETSRFATVECARSYWIYTDRGGFLEVFPSVTDELEAGDLMAHLTNEWGALVAEYRAPEDGVVVGRSTNPVADSGARILHLGVVGAPA